MPSLRKDGTPDQSENYEIIGDKDAAKEALATSRAQNATAEAGAARAEAQAAEAASLSPEEQARQDEIDAIVKQAEAEAEAEVEARWVDPASRQAEPETTTTRRSRRSASSDEG
jgi:hypothetical protein